MLALEKYFLILISILIGVSLININFFESLYMSAFFFYVITCSILSISIGIVSLKNKQALIINNILPIIFFIGLTIFYLLQSKFFVLKDYNITHYLLLTNCTILVSFTLLFSKNAISVINIFSIIVFIAGIESIICVLQFMGFTNSMDKLFAVTGSCENPNVTAMFLALSLAPTLVLAFRKKIYWIAFAFIISSLLFLKCRTAYIGAMLSTVIILNNEYNIVDRIKLKFKGFKIIIIAIINIIILVIFTLLLYFGKQQSTDGHKFVWKLSVPLIGQKPIFGLGYGTFSYYYNLEQAKYFASNKASNNEIANASTVNMAYNEFLQNLIEGGVIAFLMLSLFLIALLLKFPKHSGIEVISSYAAISAFSIMSVFNFTFQAIPVMLLVAIYVAILCCKIKFEKKSIFQIYSKVPRQITSLLLIISGAFIFTTQIPKAVASSKSKYAMFILKEGDYNRSLQILKPLEPQLEGSDIYFMNTAKAFMAKKEYRQSLIALQKAAAIKSYQNIYLAEGVCYQKMNLLDSAISAYTVASNIIPNRLKPNFFLMMLYVSKKDTVTALNIAKKIIAMKPKIPSKEAEFYQEKAKTIITKL